MAIIATLFIIIHFVLIYLSISEIGKYHISNKQKSVLRFIAPIIPYIILVYPMFFTRKKTTAIHN